MTSAVGQWLRPSRILVGVEATSVTELIAAIAGPIAHDVGVPSASVITALQGAFRRDGHALGDGVALHPLELDRVLSPVGFLVTTARPLPLPSSDGRPPDMFVFVVTHPNDAAGRLQLLTQAARLTQSPTLVEGLRQARTRDGAMALLLAAEPRPPSIAPAGGPARALVVAVIGGERAVDALLVRLLELGLDDAVLLEAQSAAEAATREVPLFAGFSDIFGDPGGRRVILVEIEADRVPYLVGAVRSVCEANEVHDAWVCALPVLAEWRPPPPPDERSEGG